MTSGVDLRRRVITAAFLLSALLIVPAPALAAERAPQTLADLMQQMAQVKSARGTFIERRELRLLNAPLDLSGTLIYEAPDRLERHTLKPNAESMILTKDTLTLEDKASKRVRTLPLQQYPLVWAFTASIRSVLAGDLATLSRFYDTEFTRVAGGWRLRLHPKESKLRTYIDDIRLTGTGAALRTVEINEAGGDRSLMTITESSRD